jgi:hypothetical protein
MRLLRLPASAPSNRIRDINTNFRLHREPNPRELVEPVPIGAFFAILNHAVTSAPRRTRLSLAAYSRALPPGPPHGAGAPAPRFVAPPRASNGRTEKRCARSPTWQRERPPSCPPATPQYRGIGNRAAVIWQRHREKMEERDRHVGDAMAVRTVVHPMVNVAHIGDRAAKSMRADLQQRTSLSAGQTPCGNGNLDSATIMMGDPSRHVSLCITRARATQSALLRLTDSW